MKIILTLVLTVWTGWVCQAQERKLYKYVTEPSPTYSILGALPDRNNPGNGTAGGNDTLFLLNNYIEQLVDSSVAPVIDHQLPVDSGYVFGTNILGYNAFAELYRISLPADSSVHILGFMTLFHGTVNPASSQQVALTAWKQSSIQDSIGLDTKTEGFPDIIMDTILRSVHELGIGATADTIKLFFFNTPLLHIKHNFFAGYEIYYNHSNLNGDTITLRATKANYGMGVGYYYLNSANDTIVIPRNVVRDANNQWLDCYYHLGYKRNLSIVPIIQFYGTATNAADVAAVSAGNLSLTGAYPNPANTNFNISFFLKTAAEVQIAIVDMAGRTVMAYEKRYQAGEHKQQMDTESLPVGQYVYMLRTDTGAALAEKLTVVK